MVWASLVAQMVKNLPSMKETYLRGETCSPLASPPLLIPLLFSPPSPFSLPSNPLPYAPLGIGLRLIHLGEESLFEKTSTKLQNKIQVQDLEKVLCK